MRKSSGFATTSTWPISKRLATGKTITGAKLKTLHTDLGKDALKNLGEELPGDSVGTLFDNLGKDALKNLASDLKGKAVLKIHNDLAPPRPRNWERT